MKKIIMAFSILMLVLALSVPAMALEDGDETRFPFQVVLSDGTGNELSGKYDCVIYYASGDTEQSTVRSGDVIYLGDGDYADILEVPDGTQYAVTELDTDGWSLISSDNTTGVIVDRETAHASFVNQEGTAGLVLPNTGGFGTSTFIMIGLSLVLCSCLSFAGKRRSDNG